MRIRFRTTLAALGMGILVVLSVLPGCSGEGGNTASPSSGRRDQVQKAHEPTNAAAGPSAKKPGAR